MLKKRQKEVLELVKIGKTNKEISEELFIALPTVKSHLHLIFLALGARSRAHAVYVGVKEGIID